MPVLIMLAGAVVASCSDSRKGIGSDSLDDSMSLVDSLSESAGPSAWSYIPVSFDEESWCFIDTCGKMAVNSKMGAMPTVPYNGFFSMTGDDGLFTVYQMNDSGFTAVKNLSSLYAVGYMEDQRIPVVRESGRIEVYSSTGKKIFEALPIDSLEVTSVNSGYCDGMLCFRLADGKMGFYDTEGNVAVKPEYDAVSFFGDGLAVAGIAKDSLHYSYSVIDRKGKVKFRLPEGEEPSLLYNKGFNNGYMIATNDTSFFLYDTSGKKLTFPPKIAKIEEADSKYVIFRDEYDDWGIADIDGQIIVLPQFAFITFAGANGPFGGGDSSKGFFACGDTESFLLDGTGEITTEFKVREALPFGKFGIFCFNGKEFELMDLQGKLKHGDRFADLNISALSPYEIIESLYFPEDE